MRGLVIGFGSIGKRHLRNLRQVEPDAELIVVRHRLCASSEPELALANQVLVGLTAAVESDPDFAVICSPSPFHVSTGLVLARRGVHLFIEKPISDRLDDVTELIAACRQRQLALLIGYILRFSPVLRAVRRAMDERRIGRVLGFDATVGQYLPEWRATGAYHESASARQELGGGALLELSHEIDCARWLAGEIRTLSAVSARVSDLEIDVEDWADLVVEFQSGAIGHIHLDMVQRTPCRSGRVVGTDGTVTWDAMANRVQLYSSATRRWEELYAVDSWNSNEMYLEEIRHFLACVRGESEPLVTGDDGRRALEVVLAARQSSETRRAVLV